MALLFSISIILREMCAKLGIEMLKPAVNCIYPLNPTSNPASMLPNKPRLKMLGTMMLALGMGITMMWFRALRGLELSSDFCVVELFYDPLLEDEITPILLNETPAIVLTLMALWKPNSIGLGDGC
jgi:hypothetical protein